MPIKILATADLHLGKRSSAVTKNSEESATKYTWKILVDYAVENSIDAVVLSGDIVDRDNRYFEAIGPLQEGFRKLEDAGVPVVMVAGNHDYDVLADTAAGGEYNNIYLLGEKGAWEHIELSFDGGSLQFVGWSFPKQHTSQDPTVGLNVGQLDPNTPTMGLLHGDIYDQNSKYAPIEQSNLLSSAIDAWILGHIHKPDTLKNEPLIMYPGSPHALSPKENGRHGPYIIKIENGNISSADQIAISPVRYETYPIEVTGIEGESEFREKIVGELTDYVKSQPEEFEFASSAIFDIEVTGRHPQVIEIDSWIEYAVDYEQMLPGDTRVSIRKIRNLAEPEVENLELLAEQKSLPGMVAGMILELEGGNQSDLLEDFMHDFGDRLEKLNRNGTYQPLNLDENQELMEPSDDEVKNLLLRECRHLLAELLSQNEES